VCRDFSLSSLDEEKRSFPCGLTVASDPFAPPTMQDMERVRYNPPYLFLFFFSSLLGEAEIPVPFF